MQSWGLNDRQVGASRAQYGENRLTEKKREGFWTKLRSNFGDPMIRVLCVALAANILFAVLGQTKWYESLGIAIAVLLATLVSTFSEYRNENAFQHLQAEASAILCKVYRNGEIVELSITELVVDDCVLLQTGDKVPADGVLVDGSLKVDQSILNGEAKEAQKMVMPPDYIEQDGGMDFLDPYQVFRGSVVCAGNAVLRVTTVGDHSVYGQIAGELQLDEERDSPLKVKLTRLAGGISKFGYIGGVGIALAVLFECIVVRNGFDIGRILAFCTDWMALLNQVVEAVILSVVIIVMAVPEGLPLMIAIVSALNMGRMLRDHVLVRKISGIETAGSLNILFSDKTGTITKGKLEAVVFLDGQGNAYQKYEEVVGGLGRVLSLSLHHNTDAVLTGEGKSTRVVGGNATERAILSFAARRNEAPHAAAIHSIPFSSENKFSAAQIESDRTITLIKGAPEKILPHCRAYYDAHGEPQPYAQGLCADGCVVRHIDALAHRAIRVLALAVSHRPLNGDALPEGDDWTLVGVIGIRDEVRPESVEAIREVQGAGVQVVMITGDRKETAVAIAKEAGLLTSDAELVLTSDELAVLSDADIKAKLRDIRVVARALPADKSRLVRLAQEMGLVAGMTGDGVNDSPALKKADVGFAMGGGTEVAKEAGDIVIMDDNFSSIDKAILYGRTIFNSVRKFIVFQLTINVAAVLLSLVAPFLGMDAPLSIMQILWVNLVMDTLAALAFGGEPALRRYMREQPKCRDEAIVNRPMWTSILTDSLWIFVLGLVFLCVPFVRTFFRPDAQARYLYTGFFVFFILSAVCNAFNARTDTLHLLEHIGRNKGFLQIIALIIAVQVGMTYFGGAVFHCYGLTIQEWLISTLLALTILPVDLLRKAIIRWLTVTKAVKRVL
ncbi:calcium-translocating P-type ATPase, PMCA-type [Ethanoligenens sp.]|uniref:calcium-translocating P-type ATPase, PMCA-type n=1 Tax=Ethanoligenens sp. TaxID=2099655 RepID=UPI0039E7FE8B